MGTLPYSDLFGLETGQRPHFIRTCAGQDLYRQYSHLEEGS
jgi:hypothetical protein